MDSHLLSLFTLHGAAPGVLDVVFGPDGDFEGAPSWTGPAFTPHRPENIAWWPVLSTDPNGSVWTETADQVDPGVFRIRDAALDLRIPSVAARLAGLCARALGMTSDGWRIEYVGMTWLLTDGLCQFLAWDVLGKPREGTPAHLPLILGRPFMSPAHFLAALTLALAPKIAVLR